MHCNHLISEILLLLKSLDEAFPNFRDSYEPILLCPFPTAQSLEQGLSDPAAERQTDMQGNEAFKSLQPFCLRSFEI
jgi:hypothetical protein